MTAPNDEEDVVVELRLQPVVARPDGWRGRSSGLIAAGLVGFIVVGIALGAAFDDRRPASSPQAVVAPQPSAAISPAATRRPNATRRPQLPPLPALEVIGGTIPTERRLVSSNGMQILDLATGELTTPPRTYEDVLLPLGDDDVVCACMTRLPPAGDVTRSTVVLRFERIDRSGSTIVERDVMTFADLVDVPEMSFGFAMAATLSADDRTLYVLTSSRRPPAWIVELHRIDVASGALLDSAVLDELEIDDGEAEPAPSDPAASATARPEGAPPDGLHVWGNALARSPDGTTMAATIIYSVVRGEVWTSGFRELLIPIVDGRPGTAVPLDGNTEIVPDEWCMGPPEFVDETLLVQVCSSPGGRGPTVEMVVRRLPTDGTLLDDVTLRVSGDDRFAQPMIAIDRARRAILSWDAILHSLARVSIDDGSTIERAVAPAMLPDSSGNSRGYFGADPGLVLSPDGRLVYALGSTLGPSDSGTPTGVWVFDAETLNLVDRWLPRAMLHSLAVSADGRFVYAAGANGFDVEGNQANWPGSVTVYDAATGEIQVIYGAVSRDSWVNFRTLPF